MDVSNLYVRSPYFYNNNNNNNNTGEMYRPACGDPTFTEHRHSKSPGLCVLINTYGYH